MNVNLSPERPLPRVEKNKPAAGETLSPLQVFEREKTRLIALVHGITSGFNGTVAQLPQGIEVAAQKKLLQVLTDDFDALTQDTEATLHATATSPDEKGKVARIKAILDGDGSIEQLLDTGTVQLAESQKGWIQDADRRLKEVRRKCIEAKHGWPEGKIPKTARRISVVRRTDGKVSRVPSFDELLSGKSDVILRREVDRLISSASETIRAGGDLELDTKLAGQIKQIEAIPEAMVTARQDYVDYEQKAIPEIKRAVGKINTQAEKELKGGTYKGECFIGKGADPIFWAVKTSRWGRQLGERTHAVVIDIGTAFLSSKGYSVSQGYEARIDHKFLSQVQKLLKHLGVQADGRFIDTGFVGSVPAALIRALDPHGEKVSFGQENRHISLLCIRSSLETMKINFMAGFFGGVTDSQRDTVGIEELGSGGKKGFNIAKYIEDAPRNTQSPRKFMEDAGRVFTESVSNPPAERIRAFAIQQSVIRSFLPKPTIKIGHIIIT